MNVDANESAVSMTIRVKYLTEEAIELDAKALLAEFANARNVSLEPPIPIEDIVEKHLRLRLEFDDLHRVLGIPREGIEPDILGAIWVERREICVDQSLDPEEQPRLEGRYRFTVAHEGGGHWRLHRDYLATDPNQGSLFPDTHQPTFVSRSRRPKERAEWQADYYASCLLMPRAMVMGAWREHFGDVDPRILPRMEADGIGNTDKSNGDEQLVKDFVRPLADQFVVSPMAMGIRLEKMGLLLRESLRQAPLFG